jgi:diacylglycerol kinase (ATP)
MSENKKVLFIINKYAGAGYRTSAEGLIIRHCEVRGIEPTLHFTMQPHHATQLAKQAALSHEFEMVFAVGGDGTVNEVAQGLVNTSVPMGIIPKGSGNGLARHLQIPMRLQQALELIGTHEVLTMDTLSVNGFLSVNVSGIGFDGHIANLFGKNGKRGLMGYSRLILKEFFNYPEFEATVDIDGNVVERKIFMLAFANSSQFGNNARIAPHASVSDGWMDICFVRKARLWKAPAFTRQLFSGRLEKSSLVEIIRGKKVNLRFHNPMPYHIDGEAIQPAATFSIEIHPGSLRVLVPG